MYASVVRAPKEVGLSDALVQMACRVFGVELPPDLVTECEAVVVAALPPPCLALTTRLQQTLLLLVRAAALRQVCVYKAECSSTRACTHGVYALMGVCFKASGFRTKRWLGYGIFCGRV